MSDPLRDYKCLLEGEITLDSTAPHNTSGAFCDLFTATHPQAGKLALKRPRGDHNERIVAHVEIEAGVWASLKHPRILQFLGIHKIGDDVYLVSAFAENGSLPGFLERRPDVDRRRLVIEIVEGLAYLHQCGIIHGDLKGNNVLICGDEHVRLCDFGLAKHVTSRTSTTLRGAGSIPWQSPELLQDASRRTYQSDVYAFGITVYEVLSGKEPYAHHVGIVPIITGVLIGERPPKEPQVALDGSSYLQFWDEASKCWAADSSLRPRVIDVLNRLDRQRAETLITSRQYVLEESLIPLTEGTPIFQFSSASALPPLPSDGANKQDTLDWAHRIRVRMNILVNSQRPVYRIPPKLIVKIIEDDLGERTWKHPLNWRSDFHSCTDSYVRHVERCAELGTVCRAWREAIENTPELTRCILVDGRKNNINYVERCNRDGPLEFALNHAGSPTWSRLSSLLGPLARCVRSLNVWSTNSSFGSPLPFPMLRVVRIHGLEVLDTFTSDLLGMLHANQDLTELILDQITIAGRRSRAKDWPRLRIDHSGLQRVRLTRLSAAILSHILQCLGLKSSVILNVDQITQEEIDSPDEGFQKLIRSLGRTPLFAPGVEVTRIEFRFSFEKEDQTSTVKFNYAVHDHALQHGEPSPRSEATSEWSQLTSSDLLEWTAVGMIRMLHDSGIVLKYATIVAHTNLLRELLGELSHITRLTIHIGSMALDILGKPLPTYSTSPDKCRQYLCPNLKILEFKPSELGLSSQGDYECLYRMVQNRQTETRSTNGLVKLQKIGLPEYIYMEHDFSGPVFEGIEIGLTGGKENLPSFS